MSTFILRLDGRGAGPRLAVKDLIDLSGLPTTAGSRALTRTRGEEPAPRDAPLMAGARAADAAIVGKTNLHELAIAPTGVNPWYGTPRNPLDPALVPGGSSSGSAVAVATGEADVAYGSDTGGSVRVPSACCGTAGLKTTRGRIRTDGVYPLAPTFDTIGPMARDVAGLVVGMQLLEPGFTVSASAPTTAGRFRLPETDPIIDAAVDAALTRAELDVADIELPGWSAAADAFVVIFAYEAFAVNRDLVAAHPESIGVAATTLLALGSAITEAQVVEARAAQQRWQGELRSVFERVEVIALPTLPCFPPSLAVAEALETTVQLASGTAVVNVAGVPAVALPIPAPGGPGLPASIQIVSPAGTEAGLLALADRVERAVAG